MSWMQTATGHRVDYLDPDPRQILLLDIARALAGNCRYMGGTMGHYSVAEHSCRISAMLSFRGAPPTVILAGHFHDATEAYMGDTPYPLKQAMPEAVKHWYKTVEHRLGTAIELGVGLPPGTITALPPIVRELDADIVVSEREQLLRSGTVSFDGWYQQTAKHSWIPAECWDREVAMIHWLRTARELVERCRQ